MQSVLVAHDVPKVAPPPPLLDPLELPELLPLLDPLELPELLPLELPLLDPLEPPELLPPELLLLDPPELLELPPVSPDPLEHAPEAVARTNAHATEMMLMDLMRASMNRPPAEASDLRACSEGFTWRSTRCNECGSTWIAPDSAGSPRAHDSSYPPDPQVVPVQFGLGRMPQLDSSCSFGAS